MSCTGQCGRSGRKIDIINNKRSGKKMLRRIDEDNINSFELYGNNIINIESKIKRLIDIVFSENPIDINLDFFDIKGTVLLYGNPGNGKTSIMNNCMRYALCKYRVDCYELCISDIIESELGKATKNFVHSISEFEKKKMCILFIDELDRICVNRNNDNELSELKRLMIELMQFFDRMKKTDNKIILCCTNVKEQIDNALLRRSTICEEIKNPDEHALIEFANVCMKELGEKEKIIKINDSDISNYDSIKRAFRKKILMDADLNDIFIMEGE